MAKSWKQQQEENRKIREDRNKRIKERQRKAEERRLNNAFRSNRK